MKRYRSGEGWHQKTLLMKPEYLQDGEKEWYGLNYTTPLHIPNNLISCYTLFDRYPSSLESAECSVEASILPRKGSCVYIQRRVSAC